MIRVRGVEKSFGEQKVLLGVDFEVGEKEIFGLLGPSGSGKTTLINILTNQTEADSGDAFVEVPPFETGLMLDEDGLYSRLTCLDNLDVFRRIYSMPPEKSLEALENVGLGDAAKKPVASL